ncbi:energy transducer TonB [Myroides sp. LJL119]
MSKLNIFNKDWIDIVFEGRNKSYGAYELRSTNPKVTTYALIIGMVVFGLALASPMLIDVAKGTFGVKKVKEYDEVIEIMDIELPPPVEELPPPPPVEELPPPPPPAVKNVNDTKKFTEPEVTKKEEVVEEIAKQEDFSEDVEPGAKDAEGDKDKGEIKTGEATGDKDKGDDEPDYTNTVFDAVQVQAAYPGGMGAFNKQFISRFRTPDIDSGTKQIRVIVQFIVEIDGSLTEIKVLRDPGYGVGKEAVRVLSGLPKWAPAQQNGRNVRSRFTLPITIRVQ